MIAMYHPANGSTCEVGSPEQAAIYAESGWLKAPEPVALPGHEAEPVTYEQGEDGLYHPVLPEPEPAKPAPRTRKPSDT